MVVNLLINTLLQLLRVAGKVDLLERVWEFFDHYMVPAICKYQLSMTSEDSISRQAVEELLVKVVQGKSISKVSYSHSNF